ncbi:hypothetical protein C2S51_006696 [Perilla frutescens var. frutescens]|nr:hypothetical protein C2S51_006696 [Perilla frutescens var. frutescens]
MVMVWTQVDEAFFVSLLQLRVGFADFSHMQGTTETLRLLAKMMSRARDRHFGTVDLVVKLKEMKEMFCNFTDFISLSGINYCEETNRVLATQVYFTHFIEPEKECLMHKGFRLNGMVEFRAVREIVHVGGMIKFNFEALCKNQRIVEMYWVKDDETFFVALLYSNLGFVDPDDSWSVSGQLCGIAEPGIKYDPNTNRVQTTKENFDRYSQNVECPRWRDFRLGGMPNLSTAGDYDQCRR